MRKKTISLPDDIIRAVYRIDLPFIADGVSFENINNTDRDGRTILFHCIIINSIDTLLLLLSYYPDLNIKDKKGWFPLHYAVQNYAIDMATLLIDHGAQIEVKDDYGNTPLWRAVFCSQGRGDMIKLLLSKGANMFKDNFSGISPIKLATIIANYNIKQFFE